jgi:hypothetical protein
MEDLARLEVECGGGVSYQLGAAGGSLLGRGLGCGLLLLWYVWANFFSICFSR